MTKIIEIAATYIISLFDEEEQKIDLREHEARVVSERLFICLSQMKVEIRLERRSILEEIAHELPQRKRRACGGSTSVIQKLNCHSIPQGKSQPTSVGIIGTIGATNSVGAAFSSVLFHGHLTTPNQWTGMWCEHFDEIITEALEGTMNSIVDNHC